MTRRSGWRRAGRTATFAAIALGGVLILVILVLALAPPLTRSYTRQWGATDSEIRMALPGDEYVASPQRVSTRAVSIQAPPELVYKLLLQVGYRRGGWYGWDWFYKVVGAADFVGGSHAETVLPELQKLTVGDVIAINEDAGYRVAELSVPNDAKPGWMLLEGAERPGTSLGNDVIDPATTNTSLVWFVYPARNGATRLVLRTRTGGPSRGRLTDWLRNDPLDLGEAVLARVTLMGIKRTAERISGERAM
jgi:hypothetical protein